MTSTVFLIIAVILFSAAAISWASPWPALQLVPLGLAFLAGAALAHRLGAR
jgi:hypothetical protein